MEEVANIFGINVFMKARKHLRPSIYIEYMGFKAGFRITSGEMFTGIVPHKERAIIKEFVGIYRERLLDIWNNKLIIH